MAPNRRRANREAKVEPVQLPPKGMRLKPNDAVGFVGLLLGLVGMIAENTLVVGLAFAACAGLMTFALLTHEELPKWLRVLSSVGLSLFFLAWFFKISGRNANTELEMNRGVLYPAGISDSAVSLPVCDVKPGALRVALGRSVVWSIQPRIRALEISGRPTITVERRKNGSLKITKLEIFDDRHSIAVSIDSDVLWIDPSTRFDRPDSSTLIVYDHNNDQILNLRFINSTLLVIKGVFRTINGSAYYVTDSGVQDQRENTVEVECMETGSGLGFSLN